MTGRGRPDPTAQTRAVEAVLLDLDGTLIDTAPDLAAAANATLEDLGRGGLHPQCVRSFIGDGTETLVRRMLGGEDDADVAKALRCFERHYARSNGRYSAPYPGVEEGLRALRAQGLRLACVTNKPMRFARPLLARFGVLSQLETLVAGDSTAAKKPDPEPVFEACRRLGVAPAACVLIGDSPHDEAAARSAGAGFLAVPYGYRSDGVGAAARRVATVAEAAALLSYGLY